jgi:hypothetical protein
MIDDNEDVDSTTTTRRPSYLDELDVQGVDAEDLAPYWLDVQVPFASSLTPLNTGLSTSVERSTT